MLDGNAIAGTLEDIFGEDMTMTTARCGGCGRTGPIAETGVYLRAPGVVVRCRSCDTVLVVVTQRRATYCIDLRGVSALDA
jgi:Family of unknown function (DUF6510)